MFATQDVLISDMSDIHDLPLDAQLNIDDAEYAHIVRRIGIDGEPGTSVSAFNSSI
jgi:FXSXX-COOH protein